MLAKYVDCSHCECGLEKHNMLQLHGTAKVAYDDVTEWCLLRRIETVVVLF